MQEERETSFKFPLNLDEYFTVLDKFSLKNTTETTLLPFKIIKKNFSISWNRENSLRKFAFLNIIDQHIGSGKLKCSKCNIIDLKKLKHYFNLYIKRDENSSNATTAVIFRSVHDVTADLNTYSFQIKFIVNMDMDYFILDYDLIIGQNKRAVEFYINCPLLLLQFKLFLKDSDTLIRNHGYLHFESSCCCKPIGMRIAIERKFTVRKIGQDKCFLHVEWELQQHEGTHCRNDSRLKCIDTLADAIAASPILTYIFQYSCHFQRQYNIVQCPDILALLENVNLKRRYNEFRSALKAIDEKKDDYYPRQFFFCAPKLDGTRHLLLLTHAAWYILNRNFIAIHGPHLLCLKFNYICHVEFINYESRYYIIDVLQLIELDGSRFDCKLKYQHISILAAVQFITNLARRHGNTTLAHSICGQYSLSCNEFKPLDVKTSEYLRQLDHTNIIKACRLLFTPTSESTSRHTDGYILISEEQILKIKSFTTIDLRISLKDWLKKIVKQKRSQLPSSLLQNISQYTRYSQPLKYNIKEEYYLNLYIPYVGTLLEYYNSKTQKYEKFASSFPKFKINLTTLSFRSLWFCNYRGVKTNVAYNFQILEFIFDCHNFSMRFNTIRDKPNCNTLIYISNILSS